MRTVHRSRTAAVIAVLLTIVFSVPVAFAVDNLEPIGSHDNVGGTYARRGECVAAGWAVDPDSPTDRVTVRISVDGSLLTTAVADQYRQDLVDAGIPGDGNSGFFVFMGSVGIAFDAQHSILIEAQDLQTAEWRVLDESPQTITCTNVAGYHDGNEGTVSRADCVASGWAADFDTPNGPRARVRVIVDGKVVAETTADQFRQDVIDAGYPTDGFVGWSVDLFGRLTPGIEHSVTAQVRDTDLKKIWLPVFDAPRHLRCYPDGIAWVEGSYTYSPFGGPNERAVTIDAHEGGALKGTWSFQALPDGPVREGTLTCLVVDGAYAWLAGPTTGVNQPDPGSSAFFYVHDGAGTGSTDEAVTWISDPGQPLSELESWCEGKSTDVPLFPLDSGDVAVHATP